LLKALAQGYIAELQGDYPAALEHYQALVGETFDPLTEDALRRIAFIGIEIQQVEFSQLALDCLANAMFVYKPQYADLLRLLGQHQAAADLYVDYLEKVPSDFGVLLKLGQLYQSMGAGDAARQVFQMVLEQDPENGAARELLSGVA
jgi:tetratricopeptide (TPR) repeat protein